MPSTKQSNPSPLIFNPITPNRQQLPLSSKTFLNPIQTNKLPNLPTHPNNPPNNPLKPVI